MEKAGLGWERRRKKRGPKPPSTCPLTPRQARAETDRAANHGLLLRSPRPGTKQDPPKPDITKKQTPLLLSGVSHATPRNARRAALPKTEGRTAKPTNGLDIPRPRNANTNQLAGRGAQANASLRGR